MFPLGPLLWVCILCRSNNHLLLVILFVCSRMALHLALSHPCVMTDLQDEIVLAYLAKEVQMASKEQDALLGLGLK